MGWVSNLLRGRNKQKTNGVSLNDRRGVSGFVEGEVVQAFGG